MQDRENFAGSGDLPRKSGQSKNKRMIGAAYEQKTAAFMQAEGYQILERNFRCRFGEIDLISRKDGYLIFTEVKFRSHVGYGDPYQAVSRKKQMTISKVAQYYLHKNSLPETTPCRFDVAAVSVQSVQILENAFSFIRSRY